MGDIEIIAKKLFDACVLNAAANGYHENLPEWDGLEDWQHEDWHYLARAALTGLRDLTPKMKRIADENAGTIAVDWAWQEMIDAVLAEPQFERTAPIAEADPDDLNV